MVFEENQFVHGSSLESVLYTDVGCTDETIGREFDVFDQPKWPLSSWKIFVSNEDDIFNAKIVLDVAPLLSKLQFGDVLAHEPAEEVVGDRLDDLPASFFKQKTAYEILGCDWSSDVCSSDLMSHHFCRSCSSGMYSLTNRLKKLLAIA